MNTTTNPTKFDSVADAAAHLAGDPCVAERVATEIRKNALVSFLIQRRVAKGMTQEQIAEAMGCDASTVSRIESDSDRQLKWMHIVGYVKALQMQMNILFDDGALPAAERIKQCVFSIDADLKKLASLAKEVGGDDHIAQEIDRFYRQVLFNFVTQFSENYNALRSIVNIPCWPFPALPECAEREAAERYEKFSTKSSALQPT